MGLIVRYTAMPGTRKVGMTLQEAGNLGLRLQLATGEALQGVLNDRGLGFVALDERPLAFHLVVFVAQRQCETPIAVEAPRPHTGQGLLGVLAAMFACKGGLDHFENVLFRIVGEYALGGFQLAPGLADGIADREVGADASCEAVEVVNDDLGAGAALFEEGDHFLEAVALLRLAGQIVGKDAKDAIAFPLGIFATGGFLRVEAVAVLGLLLAGDAAIDNREVVRVAHGLLFLAGFAPAAALNGWRHFCDSTGPARAREFPCNLIPRLLLAGPPTNKVRTIAW
nr:hypothetical protein [Sphingobium sp. OAS761]